MSDGTPIAYSVIREGARMPILYVNGWSCPDAYWAKIVPGLVAHGHPAIVPDVRGSGHSGLPRAPGFAARNLRPEDVSVERIARDMLEVLDDLGFERAALMGHSMGGQIIFEAWRLAPERVTAVIPIAGTYENPVRSFADMAALDRIYPFADALFRIIPFECLRPILRWVATPAIAHRFAQLIGLASDKLRPEDLEPHIEQICEINLSVLWRIMAQMRLHSAAERLAEMDAPVLIFAGRKDYFMPPTVQQRMHDLIPGSEIVWIDEGTHLLPVDAAEEIVERTVEFLARRLRIPAA